MLICQLDRAAGSTGGPKDSCPAQLIKNIMIRANGRDVIKNYDFETLHRLCEQRHHEMWDAVRPIDTLLDSAGLATLELIVTFGTGLDVMNDTFDGASVTVDEAKLYVSSVESVGVPAGTAFVTNKEYMIRSQVNAASARHQIQLPVGNLYRSIVIKTHSDGDQVDTVLPFSLANQNTITLQAGTEVFKYRIAGTLQADNRLDGEMQIPERTGSAAALNHRLQELLQEGYYILEFCKDGRLTECLDTSRLSSLDMILDVAHPGTDDFIDVYPVELIKPPETPAAAKSA